jgi:hypothetical protein
MTGKIGNVFVIEGERDGKCEDCGKVAELRPYGKNAANVCFQCAMKDEANATAMFKKRLFGDG